METQQSRPKLAHTLCGLVAPSSCSERWASSNSGGRAGDRGNPECHCSFRHVLKKALSREQHDKLCKQQSRGKETREETGEQWRSGCDTTAGLIGLGGNPKVCCTGIRAWLSKIHWPKTRPSSHGDLSHAAAHVVYLYFSCRISSSLNCTQHLCVPLSLWTCIGCYFELDHSFLQAFKPADISINLLLDNGPCSLFTSKKKNHWAGREKYSLFK